MRISVVVVYCKSTCTVSWKHHRNNIYNFFNINYKYWRCLYRIVPITPDIKMKAIFFNSTKMHDSTHWPLCSQSHNLLNTAASPVSPSLSPLPPSLPQSVQFLPLHHRHPGVSKHHKANHSVRGRGVAVRNLGLPTTASMLRTLELRDFYVSDTSYLHSMNAYLDFLNTHMFFLLYFID